MKERIVAFRAVIRLCVRIQPQNIGYWPPPSPGTQALRQSGRTRANKQHGGGAGPRRHDLRLDPPALAETVAGELVITRGSGRRWNEMIGIPPIAGPSSTESSVTPTGGRDAGYASAPPKATTIPS